MILIHIVLLRLKEAELASGLISRERQSVFQQQFERDIREYKSSGLLQVPSRRPTDVSLESIDLNEDDSALEVFLREDCPDLSPLPRDEVPVVKEDVCDAPAPAVNLIPADTPSPVSSADAGSVVPSGLTSRDESIYFTPDQTLETIMSD